MVRRRGKGKTPTSNSHSKIKKEAEAAQAEADSSTPIAVEGMGNREDGIEVPNIERDDDSITYNKENPAAESVNGVKADEKQEEEDYFVQNEGRDIQEVNRGDEAENQQKDDNLVQNEETVMEIKKGDEAETQQEEDDSSQNDKCPVDVTDGVEAEKQQEGCNSVKGKNAASIVEEVNKENTTEKHGEEIKCVNKENIADELLEQKNEENNGENATVEGADACNAVTKEGDIVDKGNGENVNVYEGKSEHRMLELEENNLHGAMGGKEIDGESKGTGAGENNKQDSMEENIDKRNSQKSPLKRTEGNAGQENKLSRKRSRRNRGQKGMAGKVASQNNNLPLLTHRKRAKKGVNDTEKVNNVKENDDARETQVNNGNSSDGDTGKEKVVMDVEDGGGNRKGNGGREVGESSFRVIDLRRVTRKKNVVGRALEKVRSKRRSKQGTTLNKAKKMGMIFMCTSQTKKDCYRYNILGLPASKRNLVEKIYKGMRLFLYDVDLKLLYGIYKAAGRGGYNIEPKAFNSQFPSQVRFKIVEDCLPLAEEKFRTVIKDNYYTRTKFDTQLNSEQVKNLCKLFATSGKIRLPEKPRRSTKEETKKLQLDRSRWRDGVRRPPLRNEIHQHDRARLHDSPVAHLPRPSALDPPAIGSSYVYENPLAPEDYRLEPRVVRPESLSQSRMLDLEDTLRQDPYVERQGEYIEHRDIYRHRHALEYRDSYRREPLLESRESFRHEPLLGTRDSLRRETRLETRDGLRLEPLLESRHRCSWAPILETRDSFRHDPLLETRVSFRCDPLLDSRDSFQRERLLETRDSFWPEPSESSDSYRPERLRAHRDLYRDEARLQHRERGMNLEPRGDEICNLHTLHREHPSYSDRVHPTSRAADYLRRTTWLPEYRQATSRPLQRGDMPVGGVLLPYRSSGPALDYYTRRSAR